MVWAGEVEKEEKNNEVEQEAGKQRGAGTECLTWTRIQIKNLINPTHRAREFGGLFGDVINVLQEALAQPALFSQLRRVDL